MSFVFPRNVPRLTFSGSVEAVGARERDRSRPSSSPGRRAPASVAPPPRGRMDSVDDEIATVAIPRPEIEVTPGAGAKAARQRSPMPVFNFHEAVVRPEPLLVPLSRKPSSGRSPLLAVMWVLASLLAAMGGYQYAPHLVDSVQDAARALAAP